MVNNNYKFEIETSLNLEAYILDKYVECKTTELKLDVVFPKDSLHLDNRASHDHSHGHGQEKCPDLILPFACTKAKWVKVKSAVTLLSADDDENASNKSIIDLTFHIEDWPEFVWECGDTIGILPSNAEHDVNTLLNLLDVMDKADAVCYIQAMPNQKKPYKLPSYIPKWTTPREILKDCIDIASIPKKQFLRNLAEYCSNDLEKRFLMSLTSKEGQTFYNDIILERHYTLLDILKLCKSCQPPLSLLIQHLPRLLPRCYSIASSYLKNSNEFNIIFSVIGVTTRMLQQHPQNVLMYLRQSALKNGTNQFRYTFNDFKSNQILIAIGTGIAPFLGFLQHKQYLLKQKQKQQQQQQQQQQQSHKEAITPGYTWLIVGGTCEKAIIHRDQLFEWQSTHILNQFTECHSRIMPTTLSSSSTVECTTTATTKYLHIQDALFDHSKEFIDLLLQSHTCLYLCADGGAKISQSLVACICECLCKELNITQTESEDIIQCLRNENRFREDLWN